MINLKKPDCEIRLHFRQCFAEGMHKKLKIGFN